VKDHAVEAATRLCDEAGDAAQYPAAAAVSAS